MTAEKYKRPCGSEGCPKTHYQRGFCWHHYRLMRIATEPDYLEKEARKKKRERDANPEIDRRSRARSLAKNYGITVEMHEDMIEYRNGQCDICENVPVPMIRKGKPIAGLCIDHCHITGEIRGLLCHKCNSAIGYLRDDPELLASAIRYLIRNGKPEPTTEAAF